MNKVDSLWQLKANDNIPKKSDIKRPTKYSIGFYTDTWLVIFIVQSVIIDVRQFGRLWSNSCIAN
ncbi:hypothetical protein [Salipaludibacillus neizhouensis]|uniref:hypothetical protein n=1 Tax=Salipaludibacillus neizhouensis TaxID=885475 RepID=UPI0011C436C0|nr:hypothetical protein [Salipaludibacillus neizhouensis]